MGGTQGWLSTLWSLSVIDKDGEDVRKLREQRLGDRVIKRVNKFVANASLGFMAQCALHSGQSQASRLIVSCDFSVSLSSLKSNWVF